MHLDRGYDSRKTRDLRQILATTMTSRSRASPPRSRAGKPWPVERTDSWMNGYGKLRRFTDKRKVIIEFYLDVAASLVVIRRLIDRAGPPGPPPPPPLTIICRSL
jgi:hypothetical protein